MTASRDIAAGLTEAMDEKPGVFLVVKRGLYWMPNDCGYTGIKVNAARYTEEEAKHRARPDSDVTMIAWRDAPEYTPACFHDLALDHLLTQRNALLDALESSEARLKEALEALSAAEQKIVQMYDASCPYGRYASELTINGHRSGNRFADADETVITIRRIVKEQADG